MDGLSSYMRNKGMGVGSRSIPAGRGTMQREGKDADPDRRQRAEQRFGLSFKLLDISIAIGNGTLNFLWEAVVKN